MEEEKVGPMITTSANHHQSCCPKTKTKNQSPITTLPTMTDSIPNHRLGITDIGYSGKEQTQHLNGFKSSKSDQTRPKRSDAPCHVPQRRTSRDGQLLLQPHGDSECHR